MQSNFKDVYDLNRVFDMSTTDSTNVDWNVISEQVSVVEEEFNEMIKALKNRDWKRLKDATGDVLVTAYGMGYRGSFDCDKLMKNISESNFSKICDTVETAKATQEYYAKMGVETYTKEVDYNGQAAWIVKSSKEQTYTDEEGEVKTIPKDKFLKSVKFFEPNLNVEF